MTDARQILVALISMATFLQAIKAYCDKHLHERSTSQRNDFTDLGEQTLNKHIWKCYLPSSKMGKSREVNTIEATSLLEHVKHIDDIHLIQFYKNMPIKKLEDIFITIVISNHENEEITEQLQNALYIKGIMKSAAKNGSIDVLNQEEIFKKALKKSEKITDFINRSGKHPLVSFLGVNTRTLQSFGGKKNEKK
jgi:signal recognition particle GTPase